MSLIRTSASGGFLKQYAVQFPPQTINANDSTSEEVDCPGLKPGQNIVANGNPLPTADLILQAHCRTAGTLQVFLTNSTSSGIVLASSVNVLCTPI